MITDSKWIHTAVSYEREMSLTHKHSFLLLLMLLNVVYGHLENVLKCFSPLCARAHQARM